MLDCKPIGVNLRIAMTQWCNWSARRLIIPTRTHTHKPFSIQQQTITNSKPIRGTPPTFLRPCVGAAWCSDLGVSGVVQSCLELAWSLR